MNNFEFENTTKIIFGKGEIAKLTEEIPANTKVLMTYGHGSIKKNGVYDQVKAATKHLDIIEFSGIEANPHYETLMKAVDIVKKENVDMLLAVGGGSVLDGTKFIAAASKFKGDDPWDILIKQTPVEEALPIGAVLTLPATGSEMNGGAVITRESTKEKLAFISKKTYPQFSILDPETTFSLPPRQIGNGIVDAFIHVMEQYLTYPVNAVVQDRMAEAVLLTLIEEGPESFNNPTDYDSRANFMWAATNALNGYIGCGVPHDWATHMIGHELTVLYGLDHAQTLAVVLPAMMNVMRDNKKEKLLQYAKRIWNINEIAADGSKLSVDNRIDLAIEKTCEFFESVGVKTHLSDYNLNATIISEIATRLGDRGMLNLGEKGDIDHGRVEAILTAGL